MKRQDPKRTEQLAEQFPAIKPELIDWGMPGNPTAPAYIRIQRGDGSLLYNYPRKIMRKEDWVEPAEDEQVERKNQRALRDEYVIVVKQDGTYGKIQWTPGKRTHAFLIDKLMELANLGWCELHEIDYIIWLWSFRWYEKSEEEKYLGKDLWITVYREPKLPMGWVDLINQTKLSENVLYTSREWRDILFFHMLDSESREFAKKIRQLAQQFVKKVFHPDLYDMIRESVHRGMYGDFHGVRMISLDSAGSITITIDNIARREENRRFITFQSMGEALEVIGMRGTYLDLERIVQTVIKEWSVLSKEQKQEQFAFWEEASISIS